MTRILTNAVREAVAKIFNNQHFQRTKALYENAVGVKPASGIFQRFIENKLTNISCTVVKIDDILITGKNDEEHLKNIEKVLEILNEVGATVNKSKCFFFANEIEYIGFLIDENSIRLNPRKIDSIINMPQPTNVKQLQSFLGAVNYYSKFIQNMADIAKHL